MGFTARNFGPFADLSDDLNARVAHDFNDDLTVILGWCDILATVERMAHRSGGHVRAISDPGQGTEISIVLTRST